MSRRVSRRLRFFAYFRRATAKVCSVSTLVSRPHADEQWEEADIAAEAAYQAGADHVDALAACLVILHRQSSSYDWQSATQESTQRHGVFQGRAEKGLPRLIGAQAFDQPFAGAQRSAYLEAIQNASHVATSPMNEPVAEKGVGTIRIGFDDGGGNFESPIVLAGTIGRKGLGREQDQTMSSNDAATIQAGTASRKLSG